MGALGIDRLALDRFLNRVDESFPLQRAVLFGSRARGDELEESDYDLILVSPRFADLPYARRAALLLRWWDLLEGVDLLCYTPDEFARKLQEIGMVAEAVSEGIVLRGPAIAA